MTKAEAIAEILRLGPIVREGFRKLHEERERRGLKPGEPLIGFPWEDDSPND
jgi:hypothetical protein